MDRLRLLWIQTLNAGVFLHKLGNYWRLADKNSPLLTTFPRKLLFFRMFPSIKCQGSNLILRTAKWHDCPMVVPQAYIPYKRDQVFVTSQTLALSQTRFLSRKQQAFQGPAWEASAMLRADHPWRLIPPGTPAARVAAELSLQARTLRERYPGARMQAPHQKDAHIERRPRPLR
jgi:hypothetical protein